MRNKNLGISLVVMTALLFAIGFVSAAECPTQDCPLNVSLTLDNSAPVITSVVGPAANIVLNNKDNTGLKTVYVEFTVEDANGLADIEPGTAKVTMSSPMAEMIDSTSCENTANTTTSSTFNCSITLNYFNMAGSWGIKAAVMEDAMESMNDTQTATVDALDYVSQNIDTMSWAAGTPGTDNLEAGAPLILSNGGNGDYTTIEVKAFNATSTNGLISADKFSVDNVTSSTTGTHLVEDTYTQNAGLTLPRAENSAESIFVYVDLALGLPAESYTQLSPWSVKVSA